MKNVVHNYNRYEKDLRRGLAKLMYQTGGDPQRIKKNY
jgi:hypothetical protein